MLKRSILIGVLAVLCVTGCAQSSPTSTPPARYDAKRAGLQVMYVANISDVAVLNEEPTTWVWTGASPMSRFAGFHWEVPRPDLSALMSSRLGGTGEQASETVHFKFNSSRLDTANQRRLDTLPVDVRAVRVDAYTDSVGTERYNSRLSERRAQSVKDYLVVRGVPGNKITAEGHGEAAPVASNRHAAGRAANRRADVTEDLQ